MKLRLVRALQTKMINPRVKRHAGNPGDRYALLETIGRKSGVARQTPVGYGLEGNIFWIVSEHGRAAHYVQNLVANPRVRVKVNGAWCSGNARVLTDDDPGARLKSLDPRTAAEIRRLGTSLLTVRVDLDDRSALACSLAVQVRAPEPGRAESAVGDHLDRGRSARKSILALTCGRVDPVATRCLAAG